MKPTYLLSSFVLLSSSMAMAGNQWVTCRTYDNRYPNNAFEYRDMDSSNALRIVISMCKRESWTSNRDCESNWRCDTRCMTFSNGYSFVDAADYRFSHPAQARANVIQECRSTWGTDYWQCESSVRCDQGGQFVDPNPFPNPGPVPPPAFPPGGGAGSGRCEIRTSQGLVYRGYDRRETIVNCRNSELSRGRFGRPEECAARNVVCR